MRKIETNKNLGLSQKYDFVAMSRWCVDSDDDDDDDDDDVNNGDDICCKYLM